MKLWQFVLFSFILHLLISIGTSWVVALFPTNTDMTQSRIEVQLQEIPQTDQRDLSRLVKKVEVSKDKIRSNSPDPNSFLSSTDQRVEKQTRVSKLGKPRNEEKASKATPSDPTKKGFFAQHGLLPTLNSMSTTDSSLKSESLYSRLLPDSIALGNITALNTDRVFYASFFNRIEERIYDHWVQGVHWSIGRNQKAIASSGLNSNWSTIIEVTFLQDGRVHDIKLFKPSGISDLDLAAKNAFMKAMIIPNPPKGLFDGDGLLKLKFAFNVRLDPTLVARPQ